MTTGLLLFVGGIYVIVAGSYWQQGRKAMTLAFIAYALSNLALALDARR